MVTNTQAATKKENLMEKEYIDGLMAVSMRVLLSMD